MQIKKITLKIEYQPSKWIVIAQTSKWSYDNSKWSKRAIRRQAKRESTLRNQERTFKGVLAISLKHFRKMSD